jgi:CheY-like chemotaxis protein
VSNHHAVVIDDKVANLEVMSVLLEKEAVSCTTIESPRYVLNTLASLARVDVVFLDLEFPNDDGFDILNTLKSDSKLGNVPIVAYTVHTSEIDAARRAGFHSFLGKPLNAQHFSDQLRRILNNIPVWEI